MKITKTVHQEVEIEITFPAYFQDDSYYFNVLSEYAMVEFAIWESVNSVMFSKTESDYRIKKAVTCKPITREEYESKLKEALKLADTISIFSIDSPIIDLELEAINNQIINENEIK